MRITAYILSLCGVVLSFGTALPQNLSTKGDFWRISPKGGIVWDLSQEKRLPHRENIEMAGRKVASIIYYSIDTARRLSLRRDVIFPQLQTYNKYGEAEWKKYRAYFRREIADEALPTILCGGKLVSPSKVDSISINGHLTIYHTPVGGLRIVRKLLPSMEGRYLVETWHITNVGATAKTLAIANSRWRQEEVGHKGRYAMIAFSQGQGAVEISPGGTYTLPIYYGATLDDEDAASPRSRCCMAYWPSTSKAYGMCPSPVGMWR